MKTITIWLRKNSLYESEEGLHGEILPFEPYHNKDQFYEYTLEIPDESFHPDGTPIRPNNWHK